MPKCLPEEVKNAISKVNPGAKKSLRKVATCPITMISPATKNIKIWDNGGETADRYTIRTPDGYYGMSDAPFHPQGFNQFVGDIGGGIQEGSHMGKVIQRKQYGELPTNVRKAIAQRMSSD